LLTSKVEFEQQNEFPGVPRSPGHPDNIDVNTYTELYQHHLHHNTAYKADLRSISQPKT